MGEVEARCREDNCVRLGCECLRDLFRNQLTPSNSHPSTLWHIYNFSAFFVTPTLLAPSGVVASARLCCLSRVPPAVCPSLLESATTVYNSFLQSLSTYVRTPTPQSTIRFRPAPQTPDLHTSNLPHVLFKREQDLEG